MSKLATLITSTFTGNVRAARDLNLRYTSAACDIQEPIAHYRDKEVLLEVRLRCKQWVPETPSETLEYATQSIKKAMIQEVFGEFRPIIYELHAALYDEDRTRVRTLLTNLENQMFHEGI